MRAYTLLLLLVLAACAAPAAAPPTSTPAPPTSTPASPSATGAPSSTPSPLPSTFLVGTATLTPAPPSATPSPLPSVTPTAPPTITPPPDISPTPAPLPSLNPAAPLTPTPGFPQGRIAPGTLAGLRELRAAGYGFVRAAAFVGPDRLALATSAGLLWLDLPSMNPGRFDALPGGVPVLSASHDGQLLAVVDAANRHTSIVRVADGATAVTLRGSAPAFSPDGRLIATWDSSDPATTMIWRTADGAPVSTVSGYSPIFSPDGALVVTSDGNSAAMLSRSADGAPLANLSDTTNAAFSPDSTLLAAAGRGGLRLYPITATGLGDPQLLRADAMSDQLAFSADGARLLALEFFGDLITWSVPDGKELGPTPILSGDAVQLSPYGTLLAAISSGGDAPATTYISRTSDGQIVYSDPRAIDGFVAFSPDGARAVVIKYDGGLYMVDEGGYQAAARSLRGYRQVAFSADGGLMAAADNNGLADIWRVGDGALLRQLTPDTSLTLAEGDRLGFSRDGSEVIAELSQRGFGFGGFSLLALTQPVDGGPSSTASVVLEDPDDEARVSALTFAYSQPAGRMAWVDHAGRLRLLASADSRVLGEDAGPYDALAFSPDGDLLAVARRSGAIRLIDPTDGSEVGALAVGRPIAQLAFSPGGDLLAARGADGAATVFRLADGARLADIQLGPDIDGRAPALLVAADGSMLVAGDVSGVAFYELPSGRALRRIGVRAEGLALGPEQHLLAILSDGRVTLWGVP